MCWNHAPTFAPAGIVTTSFETGCLRPVLQMMDDPDTLVTGLFTAGARIPYNDGCSAPFMRSFWKIPCPLITAPKVARERIVEVRMMMMMMM